VTSSNGYGCQLETVKLTRRFGDFRLPKLYRPAFSVTVQRSDPRNFTPVERVTPGPARRKPSAALRSVTEITALPAWRPECGRSENAAPGPSEAASFLSPGLGGGGVVPAVPAVNVPCICPTCASHWKKYVPSPIVIVTVLSPTNGISVEASTPGPSMWKLWIDEWS